MQMFMILIKRSDGELHLHARAIGGVAVFEDEEDARDYIKDMWCGAEGFEFAVVCAHVDHFPFTFEQRP